MVFGSTHIELTIENITFYILTYIVKDLSSTLILGINLLINHHTHIDYTNKSMTLNNNLTAYFSNININNINEIHPQNTMICKG